MSRSDRLLQLLQHLRTHRPPVRATDLAEAMNVSIRSIYRDIQTLRASGAVIDGAAGFGYTLTEDPALPPMMFSRDEMKALVLGLGEVREVADPVLAAAAGGALAKLRACLPDQMRLQLEHTVLHAKRFVERPPIAIDMAVLRNAARDEQAVNIGYIDLANARTDRRVWPLSIVFMDRCLMLLTWCTLRQDFRAFRCDRITVLEVSPESFRPRRVPLLRQFRDRLELPQELN